MEKLPLQPGEKSAVRLALTLAERYGYGNLIAWLKAGWAEKLMKDGVAEQGVIAAGRVTGYPISCLDQIRPPDWRAGTPEQEQGTFCSDCDGTGWLEGGKALQTKCRTCDGTGFEK